ncbi:hypothetical protein KEM52_004243 [Ascosphaera acerosa]|nr:hypothetical protein KEM52_004243 [Ascosphaera acerosa]
MSLASRRAKVLTGSMAVAIISGSWFGAGLKQRSEAREADERKRQDTPVDALAALQLAKEELAVKRDRLEGQIREVKARQAKRRAEQRRLSEES